MAAEQGHADKEQMQRVRDLFYRQLKVGHWLAVFLLFGHHPSSGGSAVFGAFILSACSVHMAKYWCIRLRTHQQDRIVLWRTLD